MPKSREFKTRSLIGSVFVPSALFSTGEYALLPIIPASAERLGADLPTAALIAGFVMIGTLLADLPAARFVNAVGERRAMIASALTAMFGISIGLLAANIWVLGGAVLLVGAAAAVFALARHGYMAEHVPIEKRARTLSLLGGTFRAGAFVGPLLSAAVITIAGITAVFVLSIVFWFATAITLWLAKDTAPATPDPDPFSHTIHIVRREKKKLLTVGLGVTVIAMLRTTRQVGIPLWALYIDISPATTALIIGIAGIVDFALFYTSGQIMDKFGRRAAAVPTVIGLSVAHLLVFTATTETLFWALVIVMALANGLGSGLILTIGADLAPTDARNEFLAGFRLLVDGGVAAAPPLLALLSATMGLAFGMGAFGVIGLGAAVVLYRYVPKFIKHSKA